MPDAVAPNLARAASEPLQNQLAAALRRVKIGAMARLNLTLDADTSTLLERHAKRARTRRATFARQILREGLAHREAVERQKQLAADYAAGRADVRSLFQDLDPAQLDLLDDEAN